MAQNKWTEVNVKAAEARFKNILKNAQVLEKSVIPAVRQKGKEMRVWAEESLTEIDGIRRKTSNARGEG